MTDWVDEFAKCQWDPVRFARVFLGIKLHPGQRRMVEAYIKRTDSQWRALYYWIMVAAGNRAGKTLALSVIILHSCVYRIGLEPLAKGADTFAQARFAALPYHWWHFAVEQAPAEQVFTEIINLLGGSHPAQKTGCPWAMVLGNGDMVAGARRIATATETGGVPWTNGPKERGEYAWVQFAPELGGAQLHFRSTKAKALSAIGQNMHGLSFDEAGLQETPTLRYLLEEIMHARRLSTGGQFVIISTPSADTSTEFEDLWYTGDPGNPFRDPRRFAMQMSTRDNIGFGIDREAFDALIAHQPEEWIRQNIDGEFIQASGVWFNSNSVRAAFKDDLPESEAPGEKQVYAHALDPGLKDKCWSVVCRITADGKIVGVSLDRQEGKQTVSGIVELGARDHERFRNDGKNEVETGVDATSLGGHMFIDLLQEKVPTARPIEFGGQVMQKRKLLSDLRTAFDEGRLQFPSGGYWQQVQKQCLNYKLADRKIEQDLVMCLAIIVKLARALPLPGAPTPGEWRYGEENPQRAGEFPWQRDFDPTRTTFASLPRPS